jgi:hypothetical protein
MADVETVEVVAEKETGATEGLRRRRRGGWTYQHQSDTTSR